MEKCARIIAGFMGGTMVLAGALAYTFNNQASASCEQKIAAKQSCTAQEVKAYADTRESKDDLLPGVMVLCLSLM